MKLSFRTRAVSNVVQSGSLSPDAQIFRWTMHEVASPSALTEPPIFTKSYSTYMMPVDPFHKTVSPGSVVNIPTTGVVVSPSLATARSA